VNWKNKLEKEMSEANIEVVRKIYAVFDHGDVAGFLECMADDIAFDHRGNENPKSPINKLFQ
jgi:ketosteroid isomerase-like protein